LPASATYCTTRGRHQYHQNVELLRLQLEDAHGEHGGWLLPGLTDQLAIAKGVGHLFFFFFTDSYG
jgi:hypothetical protein